MLGSAKADIVVSSWMGINGPGGVVSPAAYFLLRV